MGFFNFLLNENDIIGEIIFYLTGFWFFT